MLQLVRWLDVASTLARVDGLQLAAIDCWHVCPATEMNDLRAWPSCIHDYKQDLMSVTLTLSYSRASGIAHQPPSLICCASYSGDLYFALYSPCICPHCMAACVHALISCLPCMQQLYIQVFYIWDLACYRSVSLCKRAAEHVCTKFCMLLACTVLWQLTVRHNSRGRTCYVLS